MTYSEDSKKWSKITNKITNKIKNKDLNDSKIMRSCLPGFLGLAHDY